MVGLVLLVGLAYGFFPTIARILITQVLTNQGFTNIEINIHRPDTHALTIPSLAFHTPEGSGSTSVAINNTEITYSFDSLMNNVVKTVNIEQIKIIWDSALLNSSTDPLPSPGPQPDSPLAFLSFGSEAMLPILPFQHLQVNRLDISNPLAPPTLQNISLTAQLDALPEGYEGSIQLEGGGLLLNSLTFFLTQDGTASITGTHTSSPEDLILELKTTLKQSASALTLQGKARLTLHPIIHTLTALYPLPSEYQSITGTFSGTWTGTIHEHPSQANPPLGPIHGDFTLDAHMPTWPPFAQDIQLLTHGSFSVEDGAARIIVKPSSAGSVNLSLESFTPPGLIPFISHKGLRSFAWNIQQPIQLLVPIKPNLDTAQIPTGRVHIAMTNASEKLDLVLSPKNLRWRQTGGVDGQGEVSLSTKIQPAKTPGLSLKALSLEAGASFVLAPDQLAITLKPRSLLRLSDIQNKTLTIPALESRFPQGLSWIFHPTSQSWGMKAKAVNLAMPLVFFQGTEWKFGEIFTKNLVMTTTADRWAVNGETTATQFEPPRVSFNIPPSDWQVKYAVNPTSATAHFKGHTVEQPLHVGGQVTFNMLTGEGSGTMALTPIQFSPQWLLLSQLIQPWPNPNMDVTHGTISASAKVTFGKSPHETGNSLHLTRVHGMVDLKDMGGFYTPTIMKGLTTRLEIIGEGETLRIPPTPLRIKSIQSAVELNETALIFSTKSFPYTSVPILSITNMRTHLLGGMVSLANALIDPSATTHAVTLQVSGLDLNEVLRLEQQETVKGTGKLDGTLPLFISGKEITVQQGSIQGRSPGGTLHFEVDEGTASAWAKSQPQLDLIVKSLENYHYSKLAVGVDYEKSGILKLATQLEGKNPDFRKGVPIHFNLNIEENIPALLKSLALVKDLENKIETMMTGKGKTSAKKNEESSELP
jgi:hypothetical protein